MSIQFLILPRLYTANTGADGNTEILEGLLRMEGFSSQRAERTEDLSQYLDQLDGTDVVLVEVCDATDLGYCEDLRRVSQKPLLMYGWSIPSSTWIKGLHAGADAFLCLIEREEVIRARLHATLRRAGVNGAG